MNDAYVEVNAGKLFQAIRSNHVSIAKVCSAGAISLAYLEHIRKGDLSSMPMRAAGAIADYIGVDPCSFSTYHFKPIDEGRPARPPVPTLEPGKKYDIGNRKLCFVRSCKGMKVTHYLFRCPGAKSSVISYTNIDMWVEANKK